jgi:hypothetical protein
MRCSGVESVPYENTPVMADMIQTFGFLIFNDIDDGALGRFIGGSVNQA